jgi:hypothetical protein
MTDAEREALIEKMARAMCESHGLRWEDQSHCLTSGGGGDDEREYYICAAAAALAIAEPAIRKDAIEAALCVCEGEKLNHPAPEDPSDQAYNAAIDHCLGAILKLSEPS